MDHYKIELKEENLDFYQDQNNMEQHDPTLTEQDRSISGIKDEQHDMSLTEQHWSTGEIKEEQQHWSTGEIKEEQQHWSTGEIKEEQQDPSLSQQDRSTSPIKEEQQNPSLSQQDRSTSPIKEVQQDPGLTEQDPSLSEQDPSLTDKDRDEEPSSSSASSPTTKRKRVSLEDSTTAGNKKQKIKETSTDAGEDRWHNREEMDIAPDPLRFMPARTPGPTFDTMKSWSPLSLFQLFFSASVIQKIVDNTNANAAKKIKPDMGYKWQTLTTNDFYIFMSVVIFTSLVPLHHRSDYWRQQFPYNFSFPREKMSRARFEAIMWSLHLSDPDETEENEKKRISGGHDMLFKIKPLYSELVKACKTNFQPSQNISIDERMAARKAPVSVKPYLKGKSTKWGYKLFVLVDSSTGYTWNFFVDTGKRQSSTTTTNGLSYSYVMDLLPLQTLGTGYRLYIDNLYTSTTVFTDLYKKKIGCCGMISTSCIGFPQTQINDLAKKAEKGDIRWIRRGELLFVNWMDTKKVTMCSTIHKAYSNQTIRRNVKEAGVWTNKLIPAPDSIFDYNRNMGGLNMSDALPGFNAVCNETTKWYKVVFFYFLDIAVVNSYILHKELLKHRQDPNQEEPLSHKAFREQLIQEMLDFAGSPADPLPTCNTKNNLHASLL